MMIQPGQKLLKDFFDPYNAEHLSGYEGLIKEGVWTDGFKELMKSNNVVVGEVCIAMIERKMVKEWLGHQLLKKAWER